MNSFQKILIGTALASAATLSSAPASAGIVIDYPNFATSCGVNLTCVGNTAVAGNVLRLTQPAIGQSGAGYSTTAITLGASATFSTTFQFRFTQPAAFDPADGITFVLAANSAGLGGAGGGIGYFGVPNSVAIEFDTYDNGEVGGSNHVAIDTNGALTNTAATSPYGVSHCESFDGSYLSAGCMSNGDIWTATIGYDGTALTVRLQDGNGVVETLINNYAIDIAALLGTNSAFVGFTSATGSGFENHDILNWQLANDITILQPPTDGVPEPMSLGLLGIGLVGLATARRRRR